MKSILKTWIEINKSALKNNIVFFQKIIGRRVKLMAVVKSNAYGHGLLVFSKLADELGVDGFCVDSVIEGEKLRLAGIKKPILVLGPTLPNLFSNAAKNEIDITISSSEGLKTLTASKHKPNFHLKIDTGMHRQGFYPATLPQEIGNWKLEIGNYLKGLYTHFASAKDLNYPTFTERQFSEFQKAVKILEERGFKNIIKHAAATGAALIDKKYHLDWVRVGIGLYGLWPSKELEIQIKEFPRSTQKNNSFRSESTDENYSPSLSNGYLKPVLSWRTIISEIKPVQKGDFIGYDLVERMPENTKIAVLPIGYWHGLPRAFSSVGKVLISGQEAKILGRVSMDLIVVDVRDLHCKVGDVATLIGRDGKKELLAFDLAQQIGTVHYELVTRLNPLIERIIV